MLKLALEAVRIFYVPFQILIVFVDMSYVYVMSSYKATNTFAVSFLYFHIDDIHKQPSKYDNLIQH